MDASVAALSALAASAALASIKIHTSLLRLGTIAVCLIGSIFLCVSLWRQDSADLLEIAAGVIVGTTIGGAAALLVGFVQRKPSGEVASTLEVVGAQVVEADGEGRSSFALTEPQAFVIVGEAVAVAASAIDAHMGLFFQGPTSSAWTVLRRYEYRLMRRGLHALSDMERLAGAAESPEAREMFTAKAEQMQRVIHLMRGAMDALGGRIAHYQALTALLVATLALVVSLVSLVLQAYSSK